jgi:RimJ/RimL family protein N-acetyltransferase
MAIFPNFGERRDKEVPATGQITAYNGLNMRHTLHAEGFGVRLRPVQMNDAAFIVWLRNQDYVKGRVGDSAPDVASQQKWLETYFKREGDYYFILETTGGIPLGTNGVYEISCQNAEWGRYIIRPEVQAAVSSAFLIFDLAFRKLGLRKLLARCVSTNLKVHSLVKKYGFQQTETKYASEVIGGQSVDMVHFVLKAGDWPEYRRRLLPLAEFAETRIKKWEKNHPRTQDPGRGHAPTNPDCLWI